MMAFLSRSTTPPGLDDQFEDLNDSPRPEELIRERRRQLAPLGKKIREMTETAGWKEIIQPFLERRGNTARLLGLTPEKYQQLEREVAPYARLLLLVKNLLKIAEGSKDKD